MVDERLILIAYGICVTAPTVNRGTSRGQHPRSNTSRDESITVRIPIDLAPRLVALLLVVGGLLDILAVVKPRVASHLEFISDVFPGAIISASAGVSVAVGVLLIGLARGVWRGKHRAWQITVILLLAQLVSQAVQRHPALTAMCVVLLVILIKTRGQFRAPSRPSSRRQAISTLAALMGVSIVVAFISLDELANAEHVKAGFIGLSVAAAQGLVGIPSWLTAPESRYADAVYYVLLSMTATTIAVAGFLALQSARTPRHSAEDEKLVRRLVASDDAEDSLAYFATRGDRVVCWSECGRAGISYKVVAGTALAAGDPIGPRQLWPEAIKAFLALTQDMAWVPAVTAASAEAATQWESLTGFSTFRFGDEAVLYADEFTLAGRRMRNARQAAARATRAGNVVTICRFADLDGKLEGTIRDVAEQWRGHAPERGFSMGLGRIDATLDPDSLIVLAARGDAPQALLTLVPWGVDGCSLDVMRRSPTATSGVTELMIATLLSEIAQVGIRRVSLNFVIFRETIERADDPEAASIDRIWGKTIRGLTRWSQVESLYRFTAKFQPTWQARYLVYPSPASLHRVIWAYLHAESLAPRPRIGMARRRSRSTL